MKLGRGACVGTGNEKPQLILSRINLVLKCKLVLRE